MTPRGLSSAGVIGPQHTGEEIFSNMNAGIVHPLAVELKHPWHFLKYLPIVNQALARQRNFFKQSLCHAN